MSSVMAYRFASAVAWMARVSSLPATEGLGSVVSATLEMKTIQLPRLESVATVGEIHHPERGSAFSRR